MMRTGEGSVMKIAKVTSVRDLGPLRGSDARPEEDGPEGLLSRYPALDEKEQRELLRFVKAATPQQIRQTFLSKGLEGRLIAFRKAHADELRSGWAAWTPVLFAMLLVATLLQVLA